MPADIARDAESLKILESIQQRLLWLATRMVDHANRERETPSGLKVGGHQASSASMVSIMTALWFQHLEAEDRVSVKPHASPVLHAAHYLLGELDGSYLTRLREAGGLQAYPSRTKDPDRVDYSTGSVGLGAAAPLFGALTRRYVDAHFGDRDAARFISLLGDAELDEGNVWEAVADPATGGLGNVMWVVDFNRQSLDRIVPGVRIHQWRAQFEAAGWHVVEVKYGRLLTEFLALPGNEVVRDWLDAMPNEQYQSLFTLPPDQARVRFLEGAGASVVDAVAEIDDAALFTLVTDLGGHDLVSLLEAFAACDAETERPSVVFAYTIKGWGLPIAGNARNHSALLSAGQVDALREQCGLTPQTEWDHFDAVSPEGIWCNARRDRLRRAPASPALAINVPVESQGAPTRPASTQEVFGRVLVDLSRDEQVRPYLVSTAPDVATSTNLAGLINRLGVFAPAPQRSWSDDPVLKWNQSPAGHHIELGISEMNLFLLLGQLGLAWDHARQPLIPIGTVYDPFVLRGLDALIYSVYSGARFIVAGTPSGVTLAAEGGAHQSTITPSVGIELPGLTFLEPAYGRALDWLLRDAVTRLARGDEAPPTAAPKDEGAYYFRLTTRVIDQAPFEAARERLGATVLRRQVLAGGYRLVDAYEVAPALKAQQAPTVTLVGTGAVMPEVLAAAAELVDEGVAAHVVDITSADRLYSAWQRTLRQGIRTATTPSVAGALRGAFGDARTPVVTVHDGASHSMAWLGSALGVACVPLGVDSFGQSGDIDDLYRLHDLTPGSIVNAALAALDLSH